MLGELPGLPRVRVAPERSLRWLRARSATFLYWLAIFLPLVYLPLLVSGIETPHGLRTFLVLLGVHLIALVGGRSHLRHVDR